MTDKPKTKQKGKPRGSPPLAFPGQPMDYKRTICFTASSRAIAETYAERHGISLAVAINRILLEYKSYSAGLKLSSQEDITMLKLSNIPHEIYASALDNEGIERPADLADCENIYREITEKRGFKDGGFEKAIFDYMTLSGPFSEEDGEFSGVSGFQVF